MTIYNYIFGNKVAICCHLQYKGEIACHCGRISMQFDHNLDPRIGS